jgi:hypothetical protein
LGAAAGRRALRGIDISEWRIKPMAQGTASPRRHSNAYNYPVTMGGRITAMFIMFMGVGIIGALASLLSSVLVGTSTTTSEEVAPVIGTATTVEQDIAAIKDELAALRQLMEKISVAPPGGER